MNGWLIAAGAVVLILTLGALTVALWLLVVAEGVLEQAERLADLGETRQNDRARHGRRDQQGG